MNDDIESTDEGNGSNTTRPKIQLSSRSQTTKTSRSRKSSKKSSSSNQERTQISAEDGPNQSSAEEIFDPRKSKDRLRRNFIITLVVGSLIILFPILDGWKNMLVASFFMAAYYFAGFRDAKYPIIRAVFGDSMYYLGFLFTFVALVAAMTQISDQTKVDDIIAQMGPALITTVIGMAVRIYLTQFDAITDEPEIEAANSLSLLSTNLIDALQALRERSEENRQAIQQMQIDSAEQMAAFNDRLSEIDTTTIVARFNDLAVAIENLTITASNLRQRSETANLTTSDIEQSLTNLQGTATRVSTQLNNVQNFEANLNDLETRVNEATENFRTFSTRLENRVGNSASEINNSVVSLARDLSRTEEEIRNLASNLRTAVSEVVEFLNRQR